MAVAKPIYALSFRLADVSHELCLDSREMAAPGDCAFLKILPLISLNGASSRPGSKIVFNQEFETENIYKTPELRLL